MNVTGGGLTYVATHHSDEMRAFRGGLRHLPKFAENMVLDGTNSVRNLHDKFNYERGFIQHARSPSNQYLNFHFGYGGFKKYFLDRLLYQVVYRRNVRNWWFPGIVSYIIGCTTMRMYDNGAYDYFYFSD